MTSNNNQCLWNLFSINMCLHPFVIPRSVFARWPRLLHVSFEHFIRVAVSKTFKLELFVEGNVSITCIFLNNLASKNPPANENSPNILCCMPLIQWLSSSTEVLPWQMVLMINPICNYIKNLQFINSMQLSCSSRLSLKATHLLICRQHFSSIRYKVTNPN